MELKQPNTLGVGMQGRVGERRVPSAFGLADRGTTSTKRDVANRTLQHLLKTGIQLTDEAIDAKLDEEMIKGSTEALAGVAEDQLETDILTRNFTVAGHRNMTAKMRHQEWQATRMQELATGVHNDLSPTEYGAYLNESINEVMEDIRGMSQQERRKMLETVLTGNQTLVAQQAKGRTEAITKAKLDYYSIQANTLLEAGMLYKNTELEGATVQQLQALARDIYTDENIPLNVRLELLKELQKGTADMGFVNGSKGLLTTPVGQAPDGTVLTLGQSMPTPDLIKGILAVNKAEKDNKWEVNLQGRMEFVDIEQRIKQGTFQGEESDVVSYIRQGVRTNSISEGEATTLYRTYLDKRYLQDREAQSSRFWETNDIKGMQSIGISRKEGMDAFTNRMEKANYSLEDKVLASTAVFTANNGNSDIIQWVGSELLQPVLGEVINSEGGVLTENVKVFNTVMAQVDKLEGQSQQLYISSLLSSLSADEADFVMEYINNSKRADEGTAREIARETYRANSTKSESERSTAVRSNRKSIDKVVDKFSKQSIMGNFLGINWMKTLVGSEKGKVDLLTGTPSVTPWSTAHDSVVADRVQINQENAKELAEAYVRANPMSATEENITNYVLAEMSKRIVGEGDNVIVFRGNTNLSTMFPDLPKELVGQGDDVVNYILSKANFEEVFGVTGLNDMQKSFTFAGDVFHVNAYGKNGTEIKRTLRPEDLRPLVDKYREGRFERSSDKSMDRYASQLFKKVDFKHTGFDTSFRVYDYGNSIVKNYSPLLIESIYEDNLPLEGWELSLYADDPRGGSRKSIGMGVNSGNKFNSDGSRNKYTPYFEIAEKRPLTKEEAEDLTTIAVEDHLRNASAMINNRLGRDYTTASDDLTLAMFKLSYAQWKGDPTSTNKILDGVKEGDFDKIIDGLHTSRFFRDTAGGVPSGAQYEYVLSKLIGAMEDVKGKRPK